ncbi:FAS1-like dehydratase domain-containing protein [Xanthobacter autotrophicus]|uniref:FAS1-like dehydratase domain-containing protein n=1 Tax=Xanthobacter autotrophicus TaxID=280 RepID=UPI003729C6F5
MSEETPFQAWIGRARSDEDQVSATAHARFRATLEGYLAPMEEGVATPGFHWCLAPECAPPSALGSDGHPAKGTFLPPVELPRRMWAGGVLDLLEPLRLGEAVQRRTRIDSISRKSGKSGALVFVALYHELFTPRGPVIRERQDIVYREDRRPGQSTDDLTLAVPPEESKWISTFEPDTILLFRYSALTFNSHRIHYDHEYTTRVEGHAGLVVHGPLQATVLLNAATLTGARAPARFAYRGLAPFTVGTRGSVRARPDGADQLAVWMEDETGGRTMEARASW